MTRRITIWTLRRRSPGRGTCLRRKFGSIIVNNDEIISTGYAGAPRGRKNCSDVGTCTRDQLGIPRGERYEMCRSVHAEANAIISAARRDMIGATLYIACVDPQTEQLVPDTNCCAMCQAAHHQRRDCKGGCTRYAGYLPGDSGRGLGGQRRVARRDARLLTGQIYPLFL